MRNMVQNEKHQLSLRTVRKWLLGLVGRVGIEPTTCGLKDRWTVVSQWLAIYKNKQLELFPKQRHSGFPWGSIARYSSRVRNT